MCITVIYVLYHSNGWTKVRTVHKADILHDTLRVDTACQTVYAVFVYFVSAYMSTLPSMFSFYKLPISSSSFFSLVLSQFISPSVV